MPESIKNAGNGDIVNALEIVIRENRAYLSDIDGAVADGDHGVNMAKGFTMAAGSLDPTASLSEGLLHLGNTLLNDIGGSMGPLYGSFFRKIGRATKKQAAIDGASFSQALHDAMDSITELGGAKVGDKTLVDVLDPAIRAYDQALAEGKSLTDALSILTKTAETAKDATKDMVAKVGRAARLGERSRGTIDAGAASCCLILQTMAAFMVDRIDGSP